MPWFAISGSAAFRLMAWGCRCTSRICGPMSRRFPENIKRLTALGLQVPITEMDVAGPVDAMGEARPEDLRQPADIHRGIVTACLAYPGCTAIQAWGFTLKYSWIGSHSKKTEGAALLFDRDDRAKTCV